MRLIPYIRVSKEERDEDRAKRRHSLATVQPDTILAWAEREGVELLDAEVDDGVSADIPFGRRPGGARVMARLAAGEADGVVVWMLDRLFRLGLDALEVGTWLKHRGLVVQSVSDPVDITTRHGWLAFGIQALMAEHERGKIVDRSIAVTNGLRKQGRVYGGVPYGCTEVAGRLYRSPKAWQVRELIAELAGRGLGGRAIAKQLRLMGIPAPGGVGRGGKSVGGRLWHASTVLRIIRNHDELKHIPPLPAEHETEGSKV